MVELSLLKQISITGHKKMGKKTEYLDIRDKCKSLLSTAFTPSEWAKNTAYSPNALIKPTEDNGHYYRCIVAGTSGDEEPIWTTGFWDKVIDKEITWREEEPIFILDYETDISYPAIVVGDIRPVTDIQIALGNVVSSELRIDISIISYLKNKTWSQMRQQAFDFISQTQKVIRDKPELENLAGVLSAKSGVYTIDTDVLPCFYKLNLVWFVNWAG